MTLKLWFRRAGEEIDCNDLVTFIRPVESGFFTVPVGEPGKVVEVLDRRRGKYLIEVDATRWGNDFLLTVSDNDLRVISRHQTEGE
jgi:hypothetical protein